MKIEEICEHLNEIGILDIKNTPIFLSLYSSFKINNKKNNQNRHSDPNTIMIILFAFLKKVISNDKELYEICSNIINSYNKNKIIKLYQGICFLNKVIFYQIKSRFNHFLFLLFKKKYPKRKYFPYNPLHAAKANQHSFNNTSHRLIRKNINNINNIDEYSLSYISAKNKNYNNNLFLNTREKAYTQPDNNEYNEYQLSHMNNNRRNISSKKKKFIGPTEEINKKKKEISLNNMKKKIYDAQIRMNNYENILPISCKNRQKEIKEKEEENYYNKLKEDKIYQKLTEKVIDNTNIVDRLYRKEIIKKYSDKRNEKNQNIRKKSPINWDKVNIENSRKKYLNLNINSQDMNSLREILNRPKNNLYSNKKGSFSFKNSIDSKDNYNYNNEIDYNNDNINDFNQANNIENNNINNNKIFYNNNIGNDKNFNNNENNKVENINKFNNDINKNDINNINYKNIDNLNVEFKNTNINNNNLENNKETKNINQIEEEINNLKDKVNSNINKNKNKKYIQQQQKPHLFQNDSFGKIQQTSIEENAENNNGKNYNNFNDKNIKEEDIKQTEISPKKNDDYYNFPQKYDSNLKKNKNKIINEKEEQEKIDNNINNNEDNLNNNKDKTNNKNNNEQVINDNIRNNENNENEEEIIFNNQNINRNDNYQREIEDQGEENFDEEEIYAHNNNGEVFENQYNQENQTDNEDMNGEDNNINEQQEYYENANEENYEEQFVGDNVNNGDENNEYNEEEEFEYDLNNLNQGNYNNQKIQENQDNQENEEGKEEYNYEELFGDNIEEYLDNNQ